MKLEQANRYHSTVQVDGWDGTAWTTNVAAGNFMAFDRFVTDRTFGQKKRMFHTGLSGIGDQYKAVRIQTGAIYLVAADNPDIAHDEVNGHTYLLQECSFTAQVIRFTKTTAASGIGGSNTENVIATVPCDMDRIMQENSKEFSIMRYSSFSVALPQGTDITPDDQLQIDGHRYEVMEVNKLLRLVDARAVKLGVAP